MTGIKKNDDFSRVYREGRSCADRRLVMYVLDSAAEMKMRFPQTGSEFPSARRLATASSVTGSSAG